MPNIKCAEAEEKYKVIQVVKSGVYMQNHLSDSRDKSLISRDTSLPSSFSLRKFILRMIYLLLLLLIYFIPHLRYWRGKSGVNDRVWVWIINRK